MERKEFLRCAPEEAGIPSAAVMRLLDRLEDGGFTQMHGLMIMRHDKVCAEGWWAPYAPGLHHALHSLSKTWTATAVGLAEYAGLLTLDDKACDLLPEHMPDPLPERVARITVRDLLTMTSGSETEKEDYAADWLSDFFDRPFEHEPGSFWRYNSHGTAVLSAIVEKVTGMSMLSWLGEKLFPHIGVDGRHVLCRRGADGTCLGGHGMFTTTEDNLRLMRLFLRGGEWDGVRLLHERFVKEAVSPLLDTYPAHAHTPWISDNCCGYGYQIWRCRTPGVYRADGAYGQFVIVDPGRDLLISINEGAYIGKNMSHNELHRLKGLSFPTGPDHPVHGPQLTLDAVQEILLPAVDPAVDALPPDRETAGRLEERLRRLAIRRPERGQPLPDDLDVRLVPLGEHLSFSMLQGMDKHNRRRAGCERIRLQTSGGLLALCFTEGGEDRMLTADMRGGRWTGKLVYTDQRELVSDVACAAWWEGNTLTLSVLWYETENDNRYAFRFEGDTVRIHKWTETGMPDPLAGYEALYRIEGGAPSWL